MTLLNSLCPGTQTISDKCLGMKEKCLGMIILEQFLHKLKGEALEKFFLELLGEFTFPGLPGEDKMILLDPFCPGTSTISVSA